MGITYARYCICKNQSKPYTPEWNIHGYYFDTTCFGSKFNRNYPEVTKLDENIPSVSLKKFPYKDELFKIGLFDLWVSNEDRNHNNYNLLIDVENDRRFVPIDHEAIFNTIDFNHPIYEITEEESLINTDLVRNFIRSSTINHSFCEEYRNYFYFCTDKCKQNLDKIYHDIPDDWSINKVSLTEKMDQLFSEAWIKAIFQKFLLLVQYNLNKPRL